VDDPASLRLSQPHVYEIAFRMLSIAANKTASQIGYSTTAGANDSSSKSCCNRPLNEAPSTESVRGSLGSSFPHRDLPTGNGLPGVPRARFDS
jgi:hypothetical protein